MVTYGKPYLTFEQQADLLCERGMQLNRDQALWAVEHIGYYRLSGYWYPYRLIDREASQAAGHVVRLSEVSPNTTLKQVLRLYTFDRRLKLLVMDAIERVEVALRVEIAYVLGGRNPNAHQIAAHLNNRFTRPRPGRESRHIEWLAKLESQLARSSEEFVEHFQSKYDGDLPVWVAVEVLDFGSMSILFQGCKPFDQRKIAARLGIVDVCGEGDGHVLGNWLRVLNLVRNTAAHHARLWNRNFVEQVATSRLRHIPELAHLHQLGPRERGRAYPALAVLGWLMRSVDPQSGWATRLGDHLATFPHDDVVGLSGMGAPTDWSDVFR